MTVAEVDSSWTVLLPGITVALIGTGLFNPSVSAVALNSVPAEQSGLAAGINDTFRQAGIAIGVAALGALIPTGELLRGGSAADYVDGMQTALLAGAGLAAGRRDRRRAADQPPERGRRSRPRPSRSRPTEPRRVSRQPALPAHHDALEREQRDEQRRDADEEHEGQGVRGVDVLPGARRAEQDQREPDQLALERDPDRAPAAVEPHHQRGHARQREPPAERLRRQRRQHPRPLLDHRRGRQQEHERHQRLQRADREQRAAHVRAAAAARRARACRDRSRGCATRPAGRAPASPRRARPRSRTPRGRWRSDRGGRTSRSP